MPELPVQPALQDAVGEVLETMFFVSVLGEASAPPAGDSIISNLRFSGHLSGSFSVAVSREAATILAENFLGCEEQVGEAECQAVVRELSNMLCGSLLSRVERNAHWELTEPRNVADFPEECMRKIFDTDTGLIEVGLTARE